jgi:hypothetical protein
LMLLQNGQNLLCQPGKHSTTSPCTVERDLLHKQNKYITSYDGKFGHFTQSKQIQQLQIRTVLILWDVMIHSLVDVYQHFSEMYCLHLHSQRVGHASSCLLHN